MNCTPTVAGRAPTWPCSCAGYRHGFARTIRRVCIGTSATMASGAAKASEDAVSGFATRLFGTAIGRDGVIVETLQRATQPVASTHALRVALASAIPQAQADAALQAHPLAAWIEMEMGLLDGQKLERRPPGSITEFAARLAADTGCDPATCRTQLERMLSVMSMPAQVRGDIGSRAFMAFKLHQFISGAGDVHATLPRRWRPARDDGRPDL